MRNQNTNINKLYQFVLKQVDDEEQPSTGKTWQGPLPPNAVYSSIQEPPEGVQTFLTESQKVPFWVRPPQVHSDSSVHVENIKTLIENTNSTPVFEALQKAGGTPYLVGGAIRDALLNKSDIKDIDIEVHGISEDSLNKIVKDLGGTKEAQVGKQFGVFKVGNMDISLPRTETKTSMSPKEASKRRDFTMNSLMYDFNTGKIEDSFNGIEDLKNGVIRHIDDKTFVEDPLRVYRAAQFAARHEFTIHPDTIKLAKTMDLSSLPPERVGEEFFKLLLKSNKPSMGLHALEDMDVLKNELPEIQDLKGTHQRADMHAEGDVFKHTKMVMDEATEIIKRFPDEDDKKTIMLAALCHDLGKPETTDAKGSAYGHEEAGAEPTERVLDKILGDGFKEIREKVVQLVEMHLRPATLYNNEHPDPANKKQKPENQDRAVRSLLGKHSYDFLKLLSAVSEADTLGRINTEEDGTTKKPTEPKENKWFMEKVDKIRAEVGESKGRKGLAIPIDGERIKELTGLPSGKKIGDLIRHLQEKVINEGTLTQEQAEKEILDNPQLYKLIKEETVMENPIDKLWQFVAKEKEEGGYTHSPKERQSMREIADEQQKLMDYYDVDYDENIMPLDMEEYDRMPETMPEEAEENDLAKLMKRWISKAPQGINPAARAFAEAQQAGGKVGGQATGIKPIKPVDPNAYPKDATGKPDKVNYMYVSELPGGQIPEEWKDFVGAGRKGTTKGGKDWISRPNKASLTDIEQGGDGLHTKEDGTKIPLHHESVSLADQNKKVNASRKIKEAKRAEEPTAVEAARASKTKTPKTTGTSKQEWHAKQIADNPPVDVDYELNKKPTIFKLHEVPSEFVDRDGFVSEDFLKEVKNNLLDIDPKVSLPTKDVTGLWWSSDPESEIQAMYLNKKGKKVIIRSQKYAQERHDAKEARTRRVTKPVKALMNKLSKTKGPMPPIAIPVMLSAYYGMRTGASSSTIQEDTEKKWQLEEGRAGHDTGVGALNLKLKNLTLNKEDGSISLQFNAKDHMPHMINIGTKNAMEKKLNESIKDWLKTQHGITKPAQLEKIKGAEKDKNGHFNWERNHVYKDTGENTQAEDYLFIGKGNFKDGVIQSDNNAFRHYSTQDEWLKKQIPEAKMQNLRSIRGTDEAKKLIGAYLKSVKKDPKNRMTLKDLKKQIGLETGKILGHYTRKTNKKTGEVTYKNHGSQALESYIDTTLWENPELLAATFDTKPKQSSKIKGGKPAPASVYSSKAIAELKAWITNPRGSEDSYKKKKLKKENGGGGFGDGGGTVFTSSDAGVFTPTHSERGKRKKNDSKKRTGIDRLADFVDDNSPERKMSKMSPSFSLELVNWVTEELRKAQQNQLSGQNATPKKGNFTQQNSGETINNQPPRVDWKKKDDDIPDDKDDVMEFDAETDKQAAVAQNMETDRIKQLDDDDESEKPKDTGRSGETAPAGVDVQLAYESGGYQSDSLHQGSDKDLEQGDVDDPEDKNKDDEFVENFLKSLQK